MSAASTASTRPSLKNKRVLVVDDNEINLDIATETIAGAGANVDAVTSGEAALNLIGRTKYDLVVLDLTMPGMDGLAVGRALRASTKNARTPILLFTASDAPDARFATRELNAEGLVHKPVDVDELLRAATQHANSPVS
jgi:CheY-like chemotaxis protein